MTKSTELETDPGLIIKDVGVRLVSIPHEDSFASGHSSYDHTALVLIDIETNAGISGKGYLFAYHSSALKPLKVLIESITPLISGLPAAPVTIRRCLQKHFKYLGEEGMATMAMGGIDMACWDIVAKSAGLPLVRLLGGEPIPVQAYSSCALSSKDPAYLERRAAQIAADGFNAAKMWLGHENSADDIAAIDAVRRGLGPDVKIMVDLGQRFNSVSEAMERIGPINDFGLSWLEEPLRWDDYEGHAALKDFCNAPVQLGENFWGPRYAAQALKAGAGDIYMIDAMNIGGISGWLETVPLFAAANIPVSSHVFPEISAHLLAVTPTAHWLEWWDWDKPILQDALFANDGYVTASDEPGIGVAWNEENVNAYLVG